MKKIQKSQNHGIANRQGKKSYDYSIQKKEIWVISKWISVKKNEYLKFHLNQSKPFFCVDSKSKIQII